MELFKKSRFKRLYKKLGIKKSWNNEQEEYLWLSDQWAEKGFKSFIYMRNVTILKNIAEAVRMRDFHRATELSGRRQEILKIADTAKKMYLKNNK